MQIAGAALACRALQSPHRSDAYFLSCFAVAFAMAKGVSERGRGVHVHGRMLQTAGQLGDKASSLWPIPAACSFFTSSDAVHVRSHPTIINSVVFASVQTYNPRSSLTTLTFWKNGVLMAAVDAAICFFIPFYATRTNGRLTMNDVFSVGKTVFTALLGSVTLEVWHPGDTKSWLSTTHSLNTLTALH